jgi:uncharacterized membrane protein YsdA (DUF1294 family)
MSSSPARPSRAPLLVTIVFAVVLVASAAAVPLPLWIVALYAGASVVSFVVYAVDKSAARAGRRRVPERTLLALGVVGGWPGSVLAQQGLRHKTKKSRFIHAFWLAVLANVAVLALVSYPYFTS